MKADRVIERLAAVSMAVVIGTAAVASQSNQATPVARAFEHYEAIRSGLSADSVKGLSEHAAALAPLAREIGGDAAAATVEKIGTSESIADARTHFGDLSDVLVPKFLAAKIDGLHGFTCPMKKKPWVQRGAELRNPYYGKSMATCGAPIEKK